MKYLKLLLIPFAISLFSSSAFSMSAINPDRTAGGTELELINKTPSTIRVYSPTEKKVILKRLYSDGSQGSEITLNNFKYPVGAKDSYIELQSSDWDRSVKVFFKGKEHVFTKKLLKNKGKLGQKTITIRVNSDWPRFTSNDGYTVTIEEIDV